MDVVKGFAGEGRKLSANLVNPVNSVPRYSPLFHFFELMHARLSSQPWLSMAYLSPLMAEGYIAQTLPKKPKSPLQRYRLLSKGKDVLA